MATATSLEPVTIAAIDRSDWDSEEVASGQHVLYGAYGFTRDMFDDLPDDPSSTDDHPLEHPAIVAWDAMMEEVFAELHPKIADLFYEAIQRRLPWTWEPER